MEDFKKEIEVEGKTVEDAVSRAVAILKVPRSALVIKVLSEEQKGLFGMDGAKPAKILARVVGKSSRKKA